MKQICGERLSKIGQKQPQKMFSGKKEKNPIFQRSDGGKPYLNGP